MKAVIKNNTCKQVNWFRFLYCGFLLFGIYYSFIAKDYNSAAINMAIALAFDPFDQNLNWHKRPIWQRLWLVVHLGLVLTGFIIMLIAKIKG